MALLDQLTKTTQNHTNLSTKEDQGGHLIKILQKNFSYYRKFVYTLKEKSDTVSEKVDTVIEKSDTAGEKAELGDKGTAVKASAGCVVRPDQEVIDQVSNLNSASMV